MSAGAVRAKRLATGLLGVAGTTFLIWLLGLMETRFVPVAWVALVPWLLVLERLESRREAVLAGVALGMGYMASVFGWIAGGIQGYSGAPLAVCWLGYLVLAPFMQLQFITFALVRYELRRAPQEGSWAFWRVTLTGALVYVGTEWLCPKLLADTIGQGFYPSELLRQGADLAGAHGLTLLLVLGNECVLAAGKALVTRSPRRALAPLTGLAVLVLGGLGYGQLRYRQVAEHSAGQPELVVGLVQANITKYEKLAAELGTYDVVRMILTRTSGSRTSCCRTGSWICSSGPRRYTRRPSAPPRARPARSSTRRSPPSSPGTRYRSSSARTIWSRSASTTPPWCSALERRGP